MTYNLFCDEILLIENDKLKYINVNNNTHYDLLSIVL